MQVQNVNNYNPNFQAVVRAKINPKISDNVRAIVDKADELYESVAGKKPNLKDVTIESLIGESIDTGVTNDTAVKLSKQIDGMNAELSIKKPFECTELDLKLTKPDNDTPVTLHYSSFYYDSINHSYTESLETRANKGSWTPRSGIYNDYKSYAQRNTAFEKYAAALLEPAETIKKIFVG